MTHDESTMTELPERAPFNATMRQAVIGINTQKDQLEQYLNTIITNLLQNYPLISSK